MIDDKPFIWSKFQLAVFSAALAAAAHQKESPIKNIRFPSDQELDTMPKKFFSNRPITIDDLIEQQPAWWQPTLRAKAKELEQAVQQARDKKRGRTPFVSLAVAAAVATESTPVPVALAVVPSRTGGLVSASGKRTKDSSKGSSKKRTQ